MNNYRQHQFGMVSHIEILIMIVVVGAIGFAGWRILSKGDQPNTNAQQASLATQELSGNLPADLTDIKSIDEIQTLAASDADTLTIVGIELETEDNRTVYIVHYSDSSTRAYDAKSGTKLTIKDNNNDEIDDSKTLPAAFVAGITIQEAVERARAQQPDTLVRKVELEVEDGIVIYSVRFKNGSRVDINATDGSVTRVNQPSANSDNDSGGSSGSHDSGSGSSDGSSNDDARSSSDDTSNEVDDSGNDSVSDSNDNDDDDSGGDDDDNSGGSSSNSGHGSGHN